MPNLSDFGGSGADRKHIDLGVQTGTVLLDYSKAQSYAVEQGAGDITLDVSAGVRAEGELLFKRNADFAVSFGAGVLVDDPSLASGLQTTSYGSVSFNVTAQETNPQGIAFSTDGTKMFMVGQTSDSIYQYSLPTAFSLTGATYDSVSFSVAAQDTDPSDIAFSTDGTKMFMVGQTSDSVYQYSLPTAFSLTGATYDSVSFSVAAQETNPRGMALSTDGTKMFIVGNASRSVYQYSLPTAFSLTGATYDSVSLNVAAQDTIPTGISFSSDGTKLFMLGAISTSVYQYSLPTAFSLTGATYDSVSFSVAAQNAASIGIAFSADGTKLFILGGGADDTIYQYSGQFFPNYLSNTFTQYGDNVGVTRKEIPYAFS